MTQVSIQAIYENGVLKPLEPVELPDQQVVELSINMAGGQPHIVRLGGAWSPYLTGEAPTLDEIQQWTQAAQAQSLERLIDLLGEEQDDSRQF